MPSRSFSRLFGLARPPLALLGRAAFAVAFASAMGCVDRSAPDHVDVGVQIEALHSVCATTPDASAARGFDVSKWQGTIDWTKVATAGRDFVFVRSTSGASYVDPKFAVNWQGAKDAGLIRGPYHYFDVSVDGTVQADSMIAAVGALEPDDLPPVVDVEDAMTETADTIVARVAAFRDRVRAKLGREPILYSGGHFWDTYVGSTAFASTPMWTAHWFTDGTTAHCPNTPDAWARWTFWQYSSTGALPGVTGDVDLDVFDGTRADLLAFAHASRIPAPTIDGGVDADGGLAFDGGDLDGGVASDAGSSNDADVLAHPRRSHGCAVSGAESSGSGAWGLAVVVAWLVRSRTRRAHTPRHGSVVRFAR